MLITGIFVIISILSFNERSKQRDVVITFFCLFVLSIVFVYKASDFPFYRNFFINIEPLHRVLIGDNSNFLDLRNQIEIGYKLFNSFVRIFTGHAEIFFYFINGLVIMIMYLVIYGKSSNSFKLILPYFIFLYISVQAGIARQILAICFFLISVKYIIKRDILKFLLCSILAISFHRSAIVMPFFYLIVNREYPIKLMIILFLVGMLIFLEIIPFKPLSIIEWINHQIPIESVNTKINFYLWQTQNLEIPSKLTKGIFENTLVFGLLLYIKHNLSKRNLYDKFTNVALNLSLLYIFIYIYFFDLSSFTYRLNYYFVFFKFFVIVKFIENLELKSNRIISNCILIAYCAMMMFIRIGQGY